MGESVAAWLALLEAHYPAGDAESWDHVGLQVGDPAWPVDRILVTLDVTSAVVAEAAEVPGTMIVAHHPLFFRPLVALTPRTAAGRVALAAARAGVAITAVHTNLDVADDGTGTSVPMADAVGLIDRVPLSRQTRDADRAKIVTFVPHEAVEAVVDAMADAGAGVIGDYRRCSFRVAGQGTFTPTADASPYTGHTEVANSVDELRVEMEVPRAVAAPVIAALRAAHPYEEVAFDLLPLLDAPQRGLGLLGQLAEPTSLGQLAQRVKTGLPSPSLRVCGDDERIVHRVACVGGAGDSMIPAAIAAGADVLITGDLRHHTVLDAAEAGLSLIDAGHHASEWAAMGPFASRLSHRARDKGLRSPVVVSSTPTVPWR